MEPERALGDVESARALWRGRPWGALADEVWLRSDVARIEELRRRCGRAVGGRAARVGPSRADRRLVGSAVEAEPLREHRWEQLMLALYRCGRQAEALAVPGRPPHPDRRPGHRAVAGVACARAGGAGPGPEPRGAAAVATGASSPQPARGFDEPRRSRGRPAGNRKLVEASRLVTLTGVGGVGKSAWPSSPRPTSYRGSPTAPGSSSSLRLATPASCPERSPPHSGSANGAASP